MNLDVAEEKLRGVIRRRHLALATEESYVSWLKRFARFVRERSPEGTPAIKMERFLTQLARQGCSASSQNQAFNALLFFYRETLGVEVGKVDALRAKRQAAMGHSQVETTIGYCHAEALSVPSPLEALG